MANISEKECKKLQARVKELEAKESERKQMEERFQSVVLKSPIPTAVGGADGSIMLFNEALGKMIGYSRSEIKNTFDWANKLYPDKNYRDFVQKNIDQALAGKEQECNEFTITCKDGSKKLVVFYTSFFEGGLVIQMIDITERKRAEEAFRESEEKFRTFMETANDLMNITDKDGNFTYVNDSMARTLGYSKEELVGMHITQILTKESLEKDFKPNWGKFLTNGEMRIESTFLTKEGKEIYCEIEAIAIYDSDGNFVGSKGVHRDITERKRAEKELKTSELKFRALVEHLPSITYVAALDETSTTLYVSPQIKKILGIFPEEYKADPDFWMKHVHNEDRDRVLREIGRAHETGQGFISEYRMTSTDGRTVWIRDEGVIVKDDKENPINLQGIMFDITERKRAEEEIKESEERYKLVVDNAAEGILSLDLHGNIQQANLKALQISGFRREELVGKNFVQVLPSIKLDVKALLASFRNIVSGREIEKKEWAFTNKQGKQIVIRAHHSLVKKEGKTVGLSVIIEDITESKRAEETLRQSEKNYRDLFNNATDAIYIQDKKGCFLDVNQGATDMYGYPREFFIGKTPEFLSAPGKNDMKMILGFVEDAFNGKPRQYDFWGLRKNGEVFPKIVRSQKGLFQGQDVIITFATDITERKRAEEALKISEEKWKSLVENAPDVIMEVSRDGKIQKINRTVPGLSVEQVVGKNVADFMPPDQKGKVMAAIEKVFKTGESTAYEVVGAGPQGSTAYYSTRIGPIKRDGKVVNTLHVTRDITERKQAEEALKRSSLATETSMNAIFMADINGAVTYANNAAAKMWGYKSSKEMIGTNALEYWTKSTQGVAREMIGILLKVGHCSTSGKLIGKRLDGAEFSVESNSVIVKDKDGKPAGMIGSFSDITDRKKAEEEKDKLAKFMTGREGRVIELKEEVNALLKEMGKEGKYRV